MSLDVPMDFQEDDFSCTPVCVLMVCKFIKPNFSQGFPILDLTIVSETLLTDAGGTAFENVQNLNELFKKTRPSLEVVAGYRCRFEEIVEEVNKKQRPVIAWVMMPDPNGDYEHSIVVTGVDEDKLLIYCNDPVYGKQEIPTRKFMDMWNGCLRILIKFKIGEKVTLYEFS
jgi:hypothetical protein